MELKIHHINNQNICELVSENVVITTVDDAVDILGNSSYLNAYKIIVTQNQVCEGFFDLKTKIAGEILQKFSNYNIQLAIIGDFENLQSKSLRDFIYESNKTGHIFFVKDFDDAIKRLIKN